MLFLVFGATLDLGYQTRKYFASRGFTVLKKYNYVEEGAGVSIDQYRHPEGIFADWYNDKVYVSEEEYGKCDFRYELHGIHVGFNQDEILDAVHGVKDCILTLGGASLDFIKNIKKAYGGFVTVLYTYVSDEEVARSMKRQEVDPGEIVQRVKNAQKFCQVYLDEMDIFDGIIMYTGENTIYNLANVYRQYDEYIQRSEKVEQQLINQKFVDIPYCGSEPFIFISYSRKDKDRILPVLRSLQRNGYRIWYDDGVRGGQNWRQAIYSKIQECTEFLLFCSISSMTSKYVSEEMDAAEIADKHMVPVRLDNEDYPFEKKVRLHHLDFLEYDSDLERKLESALAEGCRIS
jgi:hypothetical protein